MIRALLRSGPVRLLVALTGATVLGPLAFALVLRGGATAAWPPDRPIEWWTFGLVLGLYVALMAATLLIALRGPHRAPSPRPVPPPARHPDPGERRA